MPESFLTLCDSPLPATHRRFRNCWKKSARHENKTHGMCGGKDLCHTDKNDCEKQSHLGFKVFPLIGSFRQHSIFSRFFQCFAIFSKAHILRRPGLNKRPWMFLLKRQQSQVLSAFAACRDVTRCCKLQQAFHGVT